jgi:hypothetical protein
VIGWDEYGDPAAAAAGLIEPVQSVEPKRQKAAPRGDADAAPAAAARKQGTDCD